jgi:hypothetical protein
MSTYPDHSHTVLAGKTSIDANHNHDIKDGKICASGKDEHVHFGSAEPGSQTSEHIGYPIYHYGPESCGSVAFYSKKILEKGDLITSDLLYKLDGLPMPRGAKVVCGNCGKPFLVHCTFHTGE